MKQNEYMAKKAKHVATAEEIYTLAETEGRDITGEEQERINSELAEAKKCDQFATQRSSFDDLKSSLIGSAGRISKPQPEAKEVHADIEQYSLVRAIRQMAEKGRLDGVEAEVNDELIKSSGKKPDGFYMPLNLPNQKRQNYGFVDTTTGSGFVQTVTDTTEFIELLRNKMLMNKLGAKVLTDLVGNVRIPRQSGGATAYWLDTDGTNQITESNLTGDYVSLVPNTLGASTIFARDLVKQTSLDVEALVRDDLSKVLAIELDRVGFAGSGSGATPEGIIHNSSVGIVSLGTNGGAPTWAKICALESDIAIANADVDNMAFVTTPAMRSTMKTTAKVGSYPTFLWENNTVNGYAAYATNQLPANLTKGAASAGGTNLSAAILGNFADCLYGLFGPIDVIVNPYTTDLKGSVRITMMQNCDFAVRHPGSFAVWLDGQVS